MKVLILSAIIAVALCSDPSIPILPDQFSYEFEESSQLIVIGITEGEYHYDAPNKRQAIYRYNGRYDRYCGTVFKNQETPCRHIVTNGRRYLDFPDKQYCCFCCDNSHGCGMLQKDFLVKASATYEGLHQIDENGPYQKWKFFGNQENDYYCKADGTPRRTSEVPVDFIDVIKFTLGAPDAKHFQVPKYCTSTCGLATSCAINRGESIK